MSAIQLMPRLNHFGATKQTQRRRRRKAISLYAQINSFRSLFLLTEEARASACWGRYSDNIPVSITRFNFALSLTLDPQLNVSQTMTVRIQLVFSRRFRLNSRPSVRQFDVNQMSQFDSA